jgi:predicted nucleotidyltransferase
MQERLMSLHDDLLERREEILAVAARHGARRVRVFGSVVRGEETPESDLDQEVEVEFEPGRSLLDHIALAQDLRDLLGREVDVVTEKGLHWYIRDRVCREAVPL